MDDIKIQALTAELDTIIPREEAVVRVQQAGPGESFVVGNRLGYLRLGVALLQAAFAPPTDAAGNHIPVDASALDQTSNMAIQWFERCEDIGRSKPVTGSKSPIADAASLGCALGCAVVLLIFFVGVNTTAQWLLG